MPYAILRFEKRKGGPASALEKHHERKKKQYASNPDIDAERSHLNYHLVEPQHKYYGEIQLRPYVDTLEVLAHNQRVLEQEKSRAAHSAEKSQRETIDLCYRLSDYRDFVESIPEPLRSELITRFETGQAQVEEQEQFQTL